jgi:uncharacterized membrane protein (UPF0127 family)
MIRAYLVLAGLGILASVAVADEELDRAFEKDVLVIVANEPACYRFDIYLALSREQQRRGLMFVRSMDTWTGMLFAYPSEDIHSMWMKNTFIPLDMVFARRDGTVSSVVRNTVPQSLESISSVEPVSFVLELNAGTTERLAIDAGSRLIWER